MWVGDLLDARAKPGQTDRRLDEKDDRLLPGLRGAQGDAHARDPFPMLARRESPPLRHQVVAATARAARMAISSTAPNTCFSSVGPLSRLPTECGDAPTRATSISSAPSPASTRRPVTAIAAASTA